jgi:GT2 family glycosyltransferase
MNIFVAIPSMETVPVDFVISLDKLKRIGNTSINFSVGSLVYASRDYLSTLAIMTQSDYILWLDSDMVFGRSLLVDLLASIDGKDFVSGLYFRRKPPYNPVLYKTVGEKSEEYLDYPDGLFEIDACGFGAVLMKTEMMKDIIEKEHHAFAPILGYGEDISFCIRAKRCGYQLWCDSRVKLGHITTQIANEALFIANRKG